MMLAVLLAALESDADKLKFIEIYEQYHVRMERTAMRILKEQSDAEDAVQNAFVQIIRHFEKVYKIPCDNLPFWCISIVKNEALSILRNRKKTVPLEDWDAVIGDAEMVSSYEDIVKLFGRLPETYRAALEMRLLLDYSGKEIAEHLGISESAVNTRISRGRVLLRELVEKEGFRV